ncbi:hypothetical protein CL6EHI_074480 [Entamoeba histolytica]|uniref:Uncharacterized protein n=2 Tax=Entamoeba histolytica TaxID=5759 RepID=B1N4F1_ENTH1|nr:hypothetical protein EHI_074480 [Entamoeba histolytica HM-1:IMSS]EDS89156.1 hypothetical protein EHI_074480 [Entamoeba histolytica HM-1:IMSS]GAT98230.1 hypothetical protein CL6EHI_074480 [Entamoeba histolytica]|eukprot:XP_001914067.1 hypothetical protein EHI_074480 [Entamoeba histolytica HM-1:IMSS]
MMNEIQGARNRLQQYDSHNKMIIIIETNYGDIYSVFGKEDLINVVAIETFFRVKNTNEMINIFHMIKEIMIQIVRLMALY